MKKVFIAASMLFASLLGFKNNASAQASYENGIGLFIDAGDGTYVGPHLKHYFNSKDAAQVMVLFGNNTSVIGAEYSYNQDIQGARGLKWNIGVGPQVAFYSRDGYHKTDFAIRPQAGLEYKIPAAPIAFNFDWRPRWTVTHGSDFDGARFGIGFKYTF